MSKIAIVTATRAEYGLLYPLIKKIDDSELTLDLIVTGTHLSDKYGHTIDEIINDGFHISHQIPILEEDNTPYGISCTMANAIKGFAKCFRDDRPDLVVILGDRTEMLGVASAAMNEQIPIAHIHGGELTEGAVDDCVRHALSKMSYLHFVSTDKYRKRVIQLGEDPSRVFNVGALGVENIKKQQLYSREELARQLPMIPLKDNCMPYAIVTYHPVTLESDSVQQQVEELCNAMDAEPKVFYLITSSNADAGGKIANSMLENFCYEHSNAIFIKNLGMKRYLSALKNAAFVLGNSSSGVIEAPVMGVPTVNIGDRQKGRLSADTVINCESQKDSILQAMEIAMRMIHVQSKLYGDGNTSELIVNIIKKNIQDEGINLKKAFYDI